MLIVDVGELTIEDREGTSSVRVVFVDRRLDNFVLGLYTNVHVTHLFPQEIQSQKH